MNLNEYMPTRLEDASPIDAKTYDMQFSYETERSSENEENTIRPNLRYGLTRDLQLDALATLNSGGEERGSGEVQVGGLYRLNHSRTFFPEIAINPMIVLPTGKYRKQVEYCTKLNFTSTLQGSTNIPLLQMHFNLGWATQGRQDDMLYVFGVSKHVFKNTAWVIDILHDEDKEKDSETNMIETGLHLSLGKEYYLGLGGGKGLDRRSPSWTGLLALERQI